VFLRHTLSCAYTLQHRASVVEQHRRTAYTLQHTTGVYAPVSAPVHTLVYPLHIHLFICDMTHDKGLCVHTLFYLRARTLSLSHIHTRTHGNDRDPKIFESILDLYRFEHLWIYLHTHSLSYAHTHTYTHISRSLDLS